MIPGIPWGGILQEDPPGEFPGGIPAAAGGPLGGYHCLWADPPGTPRNLLGSPWSDPTASGSATTTTTQGTPGGPTQAAMGGSPTRRSQDPTRRSQDPTPGGSLGGSTWARWIPLGDPVAAGRVHLSQGDPHGGSSQSGWGRSPGGNLRRRGIPWGIPSLMGHPTGTPGGPQPSLGTPWADPPQAGGVPGGAPCFPPRAPLGVRPHPGYPWADPRRLPTLRYPKA